MATPCLSRPTAVDVAPKMVRRSIGECPDCTFVHRSSARIGNLVDAFNSLHIEGVRMKLFEKERNFFFVRKR
jgi:hypothetical protein